MIFRRKVRPSILGISRSRRIASGRIFFIFAMAMIGSAAVVTEIFFSWESTVDMTSRTRAESSTIRTRYADAAPDCARVSTIVTGGPNGYWNRKIF